MGKKSIVVAIVLLVLTFVVSGFGSFTYAKEVRGVTEKTIKIGAMHGLTGPSAFEGIQFIEGFKTYFKHINDQGGINGRKVKVIAEDDPMSIPVALAGFKKLVYRDKAIGFFGPTSVGELAALFKMIEKEKFVTISLNPTPLAIKPLKKYVFLTTSTYEQQVMAEFDYIMNGLKAKNPRIATAYPDMGGTGKTWRDAVRKCARLYNVKVVSEVVFSMGAIDASTEIISLKRAKPDYLFHVPTLSSALLLMREARKYGFSTTFFGSMYSTTDAVVKMAGKSAKNAYGVHSFDSYFSDAPAMAEFRKIHKKYNPKLKYQSRCILQGWIPALLFAEGMKKAGRDLNSDSLVEGLESLGEVDVKGICSPVTMSSTNHQALRYSRIYKANLEKGMFEPVSDWMK